jgi:co-chaperonin GroES (HSP10)
MYQAIMDRVIVQLCDEKTSSVILGAENKPRCRGTVISVGNAVNSVKTGDKIVFHVFDELPIDGKNIVVIREKSILGIVDESN